MQEHEPKLFVASIGKNEPGSYSWSLRHEHLDPNEPISEGHHCANIEQCLADLAAGHQEVAALQLWYRGFFFGTYLSSELLDKKGSLANEIVVRARVLLPWSADERD